MRSSGNQEVSPEAAIGPILLQERAELVAGELGVAEYLAQEPPADVGRPVVGDGDAAAVGEKAFNRMNRMNRMFRMEHVGP